MANLKEVYDQYRLQLDKNKLSAQNELNKATSKSRTYMDNYLKALGLQGSGMGASANAQLGSNYASQMAQINADYNTQKLGLQQDYINSQKSEARDVLSGLNTNTDINNYLNSLKGTDAYEYANNIAQGKITANNQASFENEKQKNLAQLYTQMQGLDSTSDEYKELQNLATEIEYSQDSNALQNLYNTYLESQNTLQTQMEEENAINNEIAENGYANNFSVKNAKPEYFGKFAGSKNSNSTQSKYVNAILEASKNGTLKDGVIINFNYGIGKPTLYKYDKTNGTWTYTVNNNDVKEYYNPGEVQRNLKITW